MNKASASSDLRTQLIETAIRLLAEKGPAAIQARAIAKEVGASTMAVYSTFGGMPQYLLAVAEHGFAGLAAAFEKAPKTDDPVTDTFRLALIYREVARRNPHLYDLMFGLSTRGAYRAIEFDTAVNPETQSAAYQITYSQLVEAAERLVQSGRVRKENPAVIAAQLWSFVHGFVSLELAGHFIQFDDCVREVFVPLGINTAVGLGDSPERAAESFSQMRFQMKSATGRATSRR